jgi:REP element-mobilizing transposase RayT
MWNLPPPPGFQGLHPDKPVTIYVRHLPHWRQEGATYFVTFRLQDSLPQVKLDELEQWRLEWERQHGVGRFCKPSASQGRFAKQSGQEGRFAKPSYGDEELEELARETMRRVEQWLDQGMGSCRLKDPRAAKVVVEAMHHFDGARYELGCYVVMPNHVHAVVRPLLHQEEPLERILQSWKRHTAREINQLFNQEGHLWQDESFDRIIRDEEHLWRAIQYIGANPLKAGFTYEQCPRWIRPEWVKLGWKFDESLTA